MLNIQRSPIGRHVIEEVARGSRWLVLLGDMVVMPCVISQEVWARRWGWKDLDPQKKGELVKAPSNVHKASPFNRGVLQVIHSSLAGSGVSFRRVDTYCDTRASGRDSALTVNTIYDA